MAFSSDNVGPWATTEETSRSKNMVDSPRSKTEKHSHKHLNKRDMARDLENRLRRAEEEVRIVSNGLRNGDVDLEDLSND